MSYYYVGDFERSDDLSNANGGYPTALSQYNPYSSDTALPLTVNNDDNNALILTGFDGNQVDRSTTAGDSFGTVNPASGISSVKPRTETLSESA